jgi:hypothetical protein
MRIGISITLKPADRRRLKTLAGDRNAPHKHVWRAEIVLLSVDGIGTNEIGPANPRPASGAGRSAPSGGEEHDGPVSLRDTPQDEVNAVWASP